MVKLVQPLHYWLDVSGNVFKFPKETGGFSFIQTLLNDSQTHPAPRFRGKEAVGSLTVLSLLFISDIKKQRRYIFSRIYAVVPYTGTELPLLF